MSVALMLNNSGLLFILKTADRVSGRMSLIRLFLWSKLPLALSFSQGKSLISFSHPHCPHRYCVLTMSSATSLFSLIATPLALGSFFLCAFGLTVSSGELFSYQISTMHTAPAPSQSVHMSSSQSSLSSKSPSMLKHSPAFSIPYKLFFYNNRYRLNRTLPTPQFIY